MAWPGYVEGTGVGPYESGSVTVDASGRVRVATGSASQGQGHATTFAQIVAERLDVPLEQIDFIGGDTAAIPYGGGTAASRSIVTGGSAVAAAAQRVREKALRVGADLLEAAPDDVDVVAGAVQVKGAPQRVLTLAQIAQALLPGRDRPGGEAPTLSDESYFEPPTVTYASGVNAVVVEVDVETGTVNLLRYVVVHDCGRVVNPMIVEGQVAGGIAQGIGGTLYEDLVYDAQGQLLTATLMDYLLPTALEVPSLEQDEVVCFSPRNPLGVKGLGEGGAIGPPAAIANAVEDALRSYAVTIHETPLSPERLRAMLREAQV